MHLISNKKIICEMRNVEWTSTKREVQPLGNHGSYLMLYKKAKFVSSLKV